MRIGSEVPVIKYDGSTDTIAVASEAVVYTRSIDVSKGINFGLWLKATSATGTPSIKVEMQHAPDIGVEGDAETGRWTIKEGASAIFANVNDEVAHKETISPVPSKYIRFKLTGLAANPADSTIKMKTFIQEEV